MSFADQVRADLLSIPIKKNCCRRSLICGLFLAAFPNPNDKGEWVTRFSSSEIADFGAAQLHIQFSKEATRQKTGRCGKYYEEVLFASPSFRRQLEYLHRLAIGDLSEVFGSRCEECNSAFLRGLFLSCGTINDPQKPVHMEFLIPPTCKTVVSAFFQSIGYPAGMIVRHNRIGFYFKQSAAVEDLLALMGAHREVFHVINTRIEREIRNHENRATNCETRNLQRMVSASAKQVQAIERLMETGKLDNLSRELRETARLRLENPDSSLDELALLHNPPITKSGLNHRLRRILDAIS